MNKKAVIAELLRSGRTDLANAVSFNGSPSQATTYEKIAKYGKPLGRSMVSPHLTYFSYNGSVVQLGPQGPRYMGSMKAFREGIASGQYELQAPTTVSLSKECNSIALEGDAPFAASLYEAFSQARDLCGIRPPICRGNLGIPRIKMPQIARNVTAKFLKWWGKRGTKVKKGMEEVGKLHATQKEINQEKVQSMADAAQQGKFDPSKSPIITSKDNYILDGHHRWAALVLIDPKNKMNTYKVDAPIKDLLKVADSFEGVERRDL